MAKRKKRKPTKPKGPQPADCFIVGAELTRIVGQLNCAEQLTVAGDWSKATAALMTALSTAETLTSRDASFKDLTEKVKGLRCDYFARIPNPPEEAKSFTDRIVATMADAGKLLDTHGTRCGLK